MNIYDSDEERLAAGERLAPISPAPGGAVGGDFEGGQWHPEVLAVELTPLLVMAVCGMDRQTGNFVIDAYGRAKVVEYVGAKIRAAVRRAAEQGRRELVEKLSGKALVDLCAKMTQLDVEAEEEVTTEGEWAEYIIQRAPAILLAALADEGRGT